MRILPALVPSRQSHQSDSSEKIVLGASSTRAEVRFCDSWYEWSQPPVAQRAHPIAVSAGYL
jgi:hypothetical protein